MSIQPIPPTSAPTTAGQLAARATQNDQALAAWLGDHDGRLTDLESQSGTSGSLLEVVSGTVTLPATADAGTLLGYRVTSSATFTHSTGSVGLGAGAYIFEYVSGSWTYRTLDEGTGLTPPVPDTTPPVAGTLTASALTATSFTLTVSGASDDQALHTLPYAFSLDGGSTWSSWWGGAAYPVSGRTPEVTYSCRHKVRDAALNEATGTAIDVTTPADPTIPAYGETFTYADATLIKGLSTEIGARPMYVDSATWLSATTRAVSNANLAITGGRVLVASSATNGVAIEATTASTYRDSRNQVTYDVSAATNAAVYVSTADRESVASTNGDPIIINGNGEILRYSAPSPPLATGQPATGTIEVERVGPAVNILVNGTQVATYTATDNMDPLRFGVAARHGGAFDDWKVWA